MSGSGSGLKKPSGSGFSLSGNRVSGLKNVGSRNAWSLQCSTVEHPTDYYLNFCTKRDTKLVNDSRLLLSLSPFLLLLVLLAGSVFSQDPSELSANQLTLPD